MTEIRRGDSIYSYEPGLTGGESGHEEDSTFQWSLRLSRIMEVDNDGKKTIFEVLNRGSLRVGPTFPTRDQGSRYLGFKGKSDSSDHWKKLIEEYDNSFEGTVITRRQFSQDEKRFGRPSQGRSERLQFSTTPAVARWIATQAESNESTSETIHRLLESTMARKETAS